MENDLSNIVEALEPGLLCMVSNSHADDVPRWDLSSVHIAADRPGDSPVFGLRVTTVAFLTAPAIVLLEHFFVAAGASRVCDIFLLDVHDGPTSREIDWLLRQVFCRDAEDLVDFTQRLHFIPVETSTL